MLTKNGMSLYKTMFSLETYMKYEQVVDMYPSFNQVPLKT